MTTSAFSVVRGRVARFTRLDRRGVPVAGPRSSLTTAALVSVRLTEIVSTVSRTVERGPSGRTTLVFPDKKTQTGFSVEIDMLGTDPDLIEFMTGAAPVPNAQGDFVGNDFTHRDEPVDFALEVWADARGGPEGFPYACVTLPHLRGGRTGSVEFRPNGTINCTVTGANTVRTNRWGSGPYANGWDVLPWDVAPWDALPAGANGVRSDNLIRLSLTSGRPSPTVGAVPLVVA